MSIKFPEVVAAVRAAEDCPWKIGDALIKECGRPGEHGVNTGVYAKLRKCSRELRRLNLKAYCFYHLRELWRTAASFPDGDRSPSVTWTVHAEAGDPAALKDAIEAANRKSSPLTVTFVEQFKKQQRKGEGHAEDRQSATTLAKRDFEKALVDLLDLGVPAREYLEIIYSVCQRAHQWLEFMTVFAKSFIRKAA